MNGRVLRIRLEARLHELHTRSDCQGEARRLLPDALRLVGEAQVRRRLDDDLATPGELEVLARAGGQRFAKRAGARFKRQLEQKLFDRIWWASPFPRLERETAPRTREPLLSLRQDH
jgi:hypothetical protein